MPPNPIEFLVTFLPFETRALTRTGVQIHSLQYWNDELGPWVGQHETVDVHYDPRDITVVHVRTPVGLVVRCTVTTPDVKAVSLAEWQARRFGERAHARDPERVAKADASLERSDALVGEAKASRRMRRRKATQAAGDRYRTPSAPSPSTESLDALPLAAGNNALATNYIPNLYDFEEPSHAY